MHCVPVEEERVRLHLLAVLLFALLRPQTRPRQRNLSRERELVQRRHHRPHLEDRRHRAHHVANGVGLLPDEDARVGVLLRRVDRARKVIDQKLARIAHLARLAEGELDALAGRDHRRQDGLGLCALGGEARRPPLQLQVLVVRDHDQPPAQEGVEDVARKREPL